MLSLPTLVDLLMPRQCVLCNGELGAAEHTLCSVCLSQMPLLQWDDIHDNPMLRTLWNSHRVEAAGSSFYYRSFSRFHRLFIKLKYLHCPQVGYYMGKTSFPRWYEMGLAQGAECIVPVPLSPQRLWHRGYNQAEWIARGISMATGIPVSTDVLCRQTDKETQTHRSGKRRMRNVQGSFAVADRSGDWNGKIVLLVDDIFTTGSTIGDCIRALRECFPDVRIHVFTLGYAGD